MNEIIIFDETDGRSAKSKILKRIALNRGVKIVNNKKEFLRVLRESKKQLLLKADKLQDLRGKK